MLLFSSKYDVYMFLWYQKRILILWNCLRYNKIFVLYILSMKLILMCITFFTNNSIYTICTTFSEPTKSPCEPNPCGSNSVCNDRNGYAVCSCKPDFLGSPPNCRPECTVNSECESTKSCSRQKCINPCINTCGQNAECRVVNHAPICSCRQGFEGDPFIRCVVVESKLMFFLFSVFIW